MPEELVMVPKKWWDEKEMWDLGKGVLVTRGYTKEWQYCGTSVSRRAMWKERKGVHYGRSTMRGYPQQGECRE